MNTRRLLARTAVSAGLLLAGCGTPIKAPLSGEQDLTVAAPTTEAEAKLAPTTQAEAQPARRVGNSKYGCWDEGARGSEEAAAKQ